MDIFCDPINIRYLYQFHAGEAGAAPRVCREAADPSVICFRGRFYMFASMTLGVWWSDDLAHWEYGALPADMPLYDYAPDVRVMGDTVYFCASRRDRPCDRWRTKDILNGPWERLEGDFPFWDPSFFVDDDGRAYFYWGCSNVTPIRGVELDPLTLRPLGKEKALIEGHPDEIGYERVGEDNSVSPATPEETEERVRRYLEQAREKGTAVPERAIPSLRSMLSDRPYIEGAWMDKHGGKYYLQYAAAGTEYNTYADGVYVGDGPLGPFKPARNTPFSYRPGGFMPGAGHGSCVQDGYGAWWHAATMRISVNHLFERRVGIWPAGFDEDGELFCSQRYGDWPMSVERMRKDPWAEPEWMLLSAGKGAKASSSAPGCGPENATEEDCRTWWRAATNARDEWLCVDLGREYDVRAVQVNFADDRPAVPSPAPAAGDRYIDPAPHRTQWKLERSCDGKNWTVLEDKTGADTDLSHDLVVREEGFKARFLRLSDIAVPYSLAPCVSGLRAFGLGDGDKPAAPSFRAERTGAMDMDVTVAPQDDAVGWNILFGASPDKLYHSCMVFRPGVKRIGALVAGREYFVRVDAFNESGITQGPCVPLGGRQ